MRPLRRGRVTNARGRRGWGWGRVHWLLARPDWFCCISKVSSRRSRLSTTIDPLRDHDVPQVWLRLERRQVWEVGIGEVGGQMELSSYRGPWLGYICGICLLDKAGSIAGSFWKTGDGITTKSLTSSAVRWHTAGSWPGSWGQGAERRG